MTHPSGYTRGEANKRRESARNKERPMGTQPERQRGPSKAKTGITTPRCNEMGQAFKSRGNTRTISLHGRPLSLPLQPEFWFTNMNKLSGKIDAGGRGGGGGGGRGGEGDGKEKKRMRRREEIENVEGKERKRLGSQGEKKNGKDEEEEKGDGTRREEKDADEEKKKEKVEEKGKGDGRRRRGKRGEKTNMMTMKTNMIMLVKEKEREKEVWKL